MAKDYSKMTDEEIVKEYQAMQSGKKVDYSKMSDEEITKAYQAKNSGQPLEEVENESAGLSGRFTAKNFGGDLNTQLEYLKKQNPGKEVKLNAAGDEIIARSPGDAKFRKLDPDGFSFNMSSITDIPSDIGDIAWDLGSGAAQTAAAATAGLAGGAGSLGIGALPAGMAAGAGSGVALEKARQEIGRYLDVNKGGDNLGLGIAGVAGAASPLLFGTGASSAGVRKALENPSTLLKTLNKLGLRKTEETAASPIARVLSKSGLGFVTPGAGISGAQKALASEVLGESQKGILSGAGAKTLSMFTGAAPAKTLTKATEEISPSLVQKLAQAYEIDPARKYTNLEMADILEKQGAGDLGSQAITGIKEALDSAKQETGDAINAALSKTSRKVEVGVHAKGIEEYIAANKAAFNRTKNEVFLDEVTKGEKLLDTFKPMVSTESKVVQLLDSTGKPMAPTQSLENPNYLMTAQDAFNFKNALSDLIDYSKSPLVLDKKSATSKQLRSKLVDAERGLSDELDGILSLEGAPGAREAYRENRQLMRDLFPKFKDEDTALKTLKSIEGNKSPTLRYKLKDFDVKFGTNNIEMADLANVWRYFGNASGDAVGEGGRFASAKTGKGFVLGSGLGYLGGLATGIPGAANFGAATGAIAGTMSTSPAVVKAGLKGQTAIERLLQGAGNQFRAQQVIEMARKQKEKLPAAAQPAVSTQSGLNSLWNIMNNKRGQQ